MKTQLGSKTHKSKHEAKGPQDASNIPLAFPGITVSRFLIQVEDNRDDRQDQPQKNQKSTNKFEQSGLLMQENKPSKNNKTKIVI